MSLQDCMDCGGSVGYQAESCPHCHSKDPFGKLRTAKMIVGIILFAIVLVFGIGWYFFDLNPLQLMMKIS